MLTLQFVAIVFAGILDRIRGDGWHFFGIRIFDKFALGYCMAVAAGFPYDPIITPLITIAMTLGMSWGWGEPMGAILDNRQMYPNNLEWWQIGSLKTNPWLAVSARGALWGAPVAMVGCLQPSLVWFIPAYAIAFPLALFIAKNIPVTYKWEASELLRGWIAGTLIVASTFIHKIQ